MNVNLNNSVNSQRKFNTGLTANGNEYKKANAGKIAGNIPAAALVGIGINDVIKGKIGACKSNVEAAGCLAFGALLFSLVGTAIGSVIDNSINKSRIAQADGEAALKNKTKFPPRTA